MQPVFRSISEGGTPSSTQPQFGQALDAVQGDLGHTTPPLQSFHTSTLRANSQPPSLIPQIADTGAWLQYPAASQSNSHTFVFGQPSSENPAAFTFRAPVSTHPTFYVEDYDTGATYNLSQGIGSVQGNNASPLPASDKKINLNTLLQGPGKEAQPSPFTATLADIYTSITQENPPLAALHGEGNAQETPETGKRTITVPLRSDLTPEELKAAELGWAWAHDKDMFPKFFTDGLNEGGM